MGRAEWVGHMARELCGLGHNRTYSLDFGTAYA